MRVGVPRRIESAWRKQRKKLELRTTFSPSAHPWCFYTMRKMPFFFQKEKLSEIFFFFQSSYHFLLYYISSVQLLSRVQFFATPWTAARQVSLSFSISWSLLKLMSIGSVMPSNLLILCHPLLLLPSIFPRIRVFFNELALPISWQSIGASASAWVLPKNIQGWLPLGLTGLISLQFLTAYSSLQLCSLQLLSRNSQVFSSTTVLKPIISLKNLLFLSNSKPFLQVFIPHHEHWTRLLFSHCAKHILLG